MSDLTDMPAKQGYYVSMGEVQSLRQRIRELEAEVEETEEALRLSIEETKAAEAEVARLEADKENQLMLIARAQRAEAKLQAIRETHRQYYSGYITSGRDLCAAQEALLK